MKIKLIVEVVVIRVPVSCRACEDSYYSQAIFTSTRTGKQLIVDYEFGKGKGKTAFSDAKKATKDFHKVYEGNCPLKKYEGIHATISANPYYGRDIVKEIKEIL